MSSEKTAIIALKKGNHIGMNTIISLYQDMVYGIIYNILKNEDDALEAAQDTFMKVNNHIDQYNDELPFKAWLYKIAYRTGLDYYRKRKSGKVINESIDGIIESKISVDSNEYSIEKRETCKWIAAHMDLLHEDDKLLIQLYYFQEMSITEVAKEINQSESNVKIRLMRTRKKLHDSMSSQFNQYQ